MVHEMLQLSVLILKKTVQMQLYPLIRSFSKWLQANSDYYHYHVVNTVSKQHAQSLDTDRTATGFSLNATLGARHETSSFFSKFLKTAELQRLNSRSQYFH